MFDSDEEAALRSLTNGRRKYRESKTVQLDHSDDVWLLMERTEELIASFCAKHDLEFEVEVADTGGSETHASVAEARLGWSPGRHVLNEVRLHAFGWRIDETVFVVARDIQESDRRGPTRRITISATGPDEAEIVGLVQVVAAELEAMVCLATTKTTPADKSQASDVSGNAVRITDLTLMQKVGRVVYNPWTLLVGAFLLTLIGSWIAG